MPRETESVLGPAALAQALFDLGRECAALPDIDTRTPDELAGYDEIGLWR